MSTKVNILEASKVTLAPVNMTLNYDDDFRNFIKEYILKQQIEKGKMIDVIRLGHKISFKVKSCEPDPAIIGKNTELTILNFPEISSFRMLDINIFMSDEQVKLILSQNIQRGNITEDDAIELWKQFKKQSAILSGRVKKELSK